MDITEETVRLGTYIPESIDFKLRVFAAKRKTKISKVVSQALESYLRGQDDAN